MGEVLTDRYDALLLDLDGVVYIGAHPVPHAVEALRSAVERGLALGYVTNNAARPASEVAVHLRRLGLEVTDQEVVTSAQVASKMVRDRCGAGAVVLAVGGPGVTDALLAEGLVAVYSSEDRPVAVVQGYGPDVGWAQLAEAALAVQAGALWVATNTDLTIPTPRGIAPGNGTLVAAVRAAVSVDPVVAGKPQAAALRHAAERLRAERPLVVGDRLDTDVEGALAAGVDAALVLTGVHDLTDAAAAPPDQRPTVVLQDLRWLAEPQSPVTVAGGVASCGEARAVQDGEHIEVRAGAGSFDAARAVLWLTWAARDAGKRPVVSASALRGPWPDPTAST